MNNTIYVLWGAINCSKLCKPVSPTYSAGFTPVLWQSYTEEKENNIELVFKLIYVNVKQPQCQYYMWAQYSVSPANIVNTNQICSCTGKFV